MVPTLLLPHIQGLFHDLFVIRLSFKFIEDATAVNNRRAKAPIRLQHSGGSEEMASPQGPNSEARMAEERSSKDRDRWGSLPHQLGYMESAVSSPSGVRGHTVIIIVLSLIHI